MESARKPGLRVSSVPDAAQCRGLVVATAPGTRLGMRAIEDTGLSPDYVGLKVEAPVAAVSRDNCRGEQTADLSV